MRIRTLRNLCLLCAASLCLWRAICAAGPPVVRRGCGCGQAAAGGCNISAFSPVRIPGPLAAAGHECCRTGRLHVVRHSVWTERYDGIASKCSNMESEDPAASRTSSVYALLLITGHDVGGKRVILDKSMRAPSGSRTTASILPESGPRQYDRHISEDSTGALWLSPPWLVSFQSRHRREFVFIHDPNDR